MHSQSVSLAPLFRRRVFQSNEKVACHAQIANELSAHELCWKGGEVNTVLCKATIRQLQIFMLRYGAEVVVRPELFKGFVLVQMTLSGVADIKVDGQNAMVPQGHTAIIAPTRNVRLWWQAGSEQLILKVPVALFLEIGVCRESGIAAMPSLLLLPQQMATYWDLLLQSLLGVLALSGPADSHAAWINHLERCIAHFLWSQLPIVSIPSIPGGVASVGDYSKLKHLHALEKYIQERLCVPISLGDMARAAGVSVRGLNGLCHQLRGVTPMDLLRNIRLDAVRQRLLLQPGSNITNTAFEFGFAHLGRFSAYYRQRFGELPKQTRAHRH